MAAYIGNVAVKFNLSGCCCFNENIDYSVQTIEIQAVIH